MEGPIPRDPDDSEESDESQTPAPSPEPDATADPDTSAQPARDVWTPGGDHEPVGAAALPDPVPGPLPAASAEPGEPYPEVPVLEPVYGWLHPLIDAEVDTDGVLAVFGRHSALAALDGTPTGPGVSREFVVLADPDDRAVTLADGRLRPGPVVADLAQELVASTGHAVEVGSVMLAIDVGEEQRTYGSPLDTEEEAARAAAHRDVLLGRLAEESLPLLARHVGSPLEVWEVDAPQGPCVMVRPTEPGARLHEHRFPTPELPVVALTRMGGTRSVTVLTHPGHLPDVFLTHREPWLAALSPDDAADLPPVEAAALSRALTWFAAPHLAPDSELSRLVAVGPPGLDAAAIARALQSPDDDGWWNRVLSTLGVPGVLADLAEGRPVPGAPRRVEMAGLRTALTSPFRRPGAGRSGPPEPADPEQAGPQQPDPEQPDRKQPDDPDT